MPGDNKSIILFAGGIVGVAFFEHLLAAHKKGICQFSGVMPAGKDEGKNLSLRHQAETSGVIVFDNPEDILKIPAPWLGFSAGNSFLLADAVLSAPENGLINFHAAPLPRFPGSATPAFAIAEGAREFGVTFHKMVTEIDAGPIVLSRSFLIDDNSTAKDVNAQCIEIGVECFHDNLSDLVDLRFAESANTIDRPPYKRSDMEAYRKLDMAWPSEKIWNHIRACDWDGVLPPAYIDVCGKKVFVTAQVRDRNCYL